MKVLLLGPYPPPHGGVQIHLVALREFLRRSGVASAVIDITRHKKVEADEIYYPKNAVALIALLGRLKYDIVHLHFGGDLTSRLLALTLVCRAMPRPKKLVMTFHSGGYPTSEAGRTAQPGTFRGFVLRRLDCVIGVNQALVDMFRRFGVTADRVRLIPPHSPVQVEQVSSADKWPEKLATFFATHSPVLLTVGLLEPEYDLPLQIEMLNELRRTSPRAGLVIIGSGSLEQNIRERIASKAYADHILLCGDVPHALTLEAISRSSVLMRTTHYDGDSISVREALSLGTPVLATDNGMRPAGVHLISAANPASLSRDVERCLAQRSQGTSRLTRADESADKNLQAVLDLYRSL